MRIPNRRNHIQWISRRLMNSRIHAPARCLPERAPDYTGLGKALPSPSLPFAGGGGFLCGDSNVAPVFQSHALALSFAHFFQFFGDFFHGPVSLRCHLGPENSRPCCDQGPCRSSMVARREGSAGSPAIGVVGKLRSETRRGRNGRTAAAFFGSRGATKPRASSCDVVIMRPGDESQIATVGKSSSYLRLECLQSQPAMSESSSCDRFAFA
jgi:hypothetical protein